MKHTISDTFDVCVKISACPEKLASEIFKNVHQDDTFYVYEPGYKSNND